MGVSITNCCYVNRISGKRNSKLFTTGYIIRVHVQLYYIVHVHVHGGLYTYMYYYNEVTFLDV